MPYHGALNINKIRWTNTCSNPTIKTLKQRPRILVWCLLLLTLSSYFFIGTNFVGVQQELSDVIQILDQHTIRYELNQKRIIQLKFNPLSSSSPWMGVCMKAMGKFTKSLKEIVQIMYLHWVGSVLTIIQTISGNLFLPKVTRKETRSSASFRETLGIS